MKRIIQGYRMEYRPFCKFSTLCVVEGKCISLSIHISIYNYDYKNHTNVTCIYLRGLCE